MTKLLKSIKREVSVYGTRPIIIEIDPETKRIGFHEKGCRKTYWLPIVTAFAMAIRAEEKSHQSLKGEKI
jgi:hypothetical protein